MSPGVEHIQVHTRACIGKTSRVTSTSLCIQEPSRRGGPWAFLFTAKWPQKSPALSRRKCHKLCLNWNLREQILCISICHLTEISSRNVLRISLWTQVCYSLCSINLDVSYHMFEGHLKLWTDTPTCCQTGCYRNDRSLTPVAVISSSSFRKKVKAWHVRKASHYFWRVTLHQIK